MKVLNYNPYDYNTVAFKKINDNREDYLPQASTLIQNKNANALAKFLGIDTTKEWNQYYDKIFLIYSWAKKKTQSDDLEKILGAVTDKLNASTQISNHRIVDLAVAIEIGSKDDKPEPVEVKPEEVELKPKEKKIVKKAKPKIVEPEPEPEVPLTPLQQVRKFMYGSKSEGVSPI